jgi:hypothetical protein
MLRRLQILDLWAGPAKRFGHLLNEPGFRSLRAAEQGRALVRTGTEAGFEKPQASLSIVRFWGKANEHSQEIGAPKHQKPLPVGRPYGKLDRLIAEHGRYDDAFLCMAAHAEQRLPASRRRMGLCTKSYNAAPGRRVLTAEGLSFTVPKE